MELYQGSGWNEILSELPRAHVLQTWDWGQFKSGVGWRPEPYIWRDDEGKVFAAALVLKRSVPGGLSVLYVPRGPLVDWDNPKQAQQVIQDLQRLAKKSGAIFIKMDPEIVLGTGIPQSEQDQVNPEGEGLLKWMANQGWRYSQDQIQFRNTVTLLLTGDEESWLARMKQKARYNLRLAQRKGVLVRPGNAADLSALYHLYAETSVRDGFAIRSEEYYLKLWRSFMERGLAQPLIAEVDGSMVAGLVLFQFARRAWYLYGMSSQQHREKMPNHLLQWEAMCWAKSQGCAEYDLWGAPEVFDESDSMWGVFRFKDGLGGTVVRTVGAWDFSTRPWLYNLYTQILPRLLDIMRRRGKARTRQEVTL